eukprot:SAG31_NODE_1366_length_8621_cov_4.579911_6_plen_89_part_00
MIELRWRAFTEYSERIAGAHYLCYSAIAPWTQEEEDELKSFVSEHGAATDWQANEHTFLKTCSVSSVLCCVPMEPNRQPHVTVCIQQE